MRASGRTHLIALTILAGVAGCGETNDTKVIVVDTPPTPIDGGPTTTAARTATPAGATATPVIGATPSPTATDTAPGATATATATAASTPVPTATPAGSINADVQRIADDIVPFLAHTVLLTGGSIDQVVGANPSYGTAVLAARTDDCPDGGSRVDDEGFPARRLTFAACDVANALGSFRFDGEVVVTLNGLAGGSIAFDFTLTDRDTSRAVAFLGTLPLSITSDGFELEGTVAVTTPQGTFTLRSDDVTINSSRKVIAGSGSVGDDDDNFDLETVAFVVVSRGAAANLTATFDDASVETYRLDLETGELTIR